MFSVICTVWKNEKFPLISAKKYFVKSTLVKPLLSRNFCQNMWGRISNISTLWSAHCTITLCILRKSTLRHFWQKFRESNVYTKEVTKELMSREKKKFAFYPTVTTVQCRNSLSHFFKLLHCAQCGKTKIHLHANFFPVKSIYIKVL